MNSVEKTRLRELATLLKKTRALWESGRVVEAQAVLDQAIQDAEKNMVRWAENRPSAAMPLG